MFLNRTKAVIKVLTVDNSAVMLKIFSQKLSREVGRKEGVVGTTRNPKERQGGRVRIKLDCRL